jgi:hypothetical protein
MNSAGSLQRRVLEAIALFTHRDRSGRSTCAPTYTGGMNDKARLELDFTPTDFAKGAPYHRMVSRRKADHLPELDC